LDEVWKERATFRYNKGVSGRGRARFTAPQMDRVRRIMGYYTNLEPIAGVSFPPEDRPFNSCRSGALARREEGLNVRF
jgi:hypothetical protein